MTRSKLFSKTREELKELRMIERSIETLSRAEEKMNKEIEKAEKYSECGIKKEASSALFSLIDRAISLKEYYYPLIARLEPIDRIIILDGYINKTPYRTLGRQLGYTKEGVQKRTYIIIDRISKMCEGL